LWADRSASFARTQLNAHGTADAAIVPKMTNDDEHGTPQPVSERELRLREADRAEFAATARRRLGRSRAESESELRVLGEAWARNASIVSL
jgi:hypothetical protein